MEKNGMTVEKEAMITQASEAEIQADVQEQPPKKEVEQEVILQYREYEANMEAVVERVKSHYIAKGYTEDSIESIQIYVKPEDFTAYYVINDGVVGKVNLF